jgi:hypothetical protein
MAPSRRVAFVSVLLAPWVGGARQQDPSDDELPGMPSNQRHKLPLPEPNGDKKLPNGKSQNDAIAQEEHKRSLKEADELVSLAEEIRAELRKAGNYVVPLSTLKKTEEIEKLAKRIRNRLKA